MNKKYLLIIPCSKRKSHVNHGIMPALELYDGPFYRTIRKIFKDQGEIDYLDIKILSAKYGIIDQKARITTYDQRMTTFIAINMADAVYKSFEKILNENIYKEILINLGKTYLLALMKSKKILEDNRTRYINGRIGQRNSQLKEWILSIYNDGITL